MVARKNSTGISRRTLVRTGAHAAWVVPAITLATAAPALAVSTNPKVVTSDVSGTIDLKKLKIKATFTNTGSVKATSMTVMVTVTNADGTLGTTITGLKDGAWAFAGAGGTAFERTYTFVRADGLDVGQHKDLEFIPDSTLGADKAPTGGGVITIAAPITTPAGTNSGGAATYDALQPVVVTSEITAKIKDGETLQVSAKFTNNGLVDATSLSVSVTLTNANGTLANTVNDFSGGWTFNGATGTRFARTYSFTRSAGLDAGSNKTLKFEPESTGGDDDEPPSGGGTIAIAPPTTTPAGSNSGGTGSYPAS
ncbi:hypothetical protein [Nocardioides sp.]|uniref:hypothetical protein n=1 Tax=Nocardioides sp. TaxID=35761 RepID=UPI003566466E